MTGEAFWSLVRQTLFEPRDAAQRIVSSGLSARDGWLALALMAVLNTLVYSLSARLNPPADPAMSEMMGPALGAPLVFAAALFAALALTAVAFMQAGRALGGTATTTDMLVLLAWMQALRLMVQVVLVVLAMAMPALAGIVVIVAAVWGLWILLAFMAEAHGFESLWRAAGALAIAFAGLVFGLSLLFSLVGMRVAGGM
ncbi:MAG TPA: YIP1 family protein [Roseovarius sp.]|nr:YIP1 family protein [Roseovarius sp.]